MHLIELYSTSTGSKIDKPFIYESFFPIPEEKYITFQAQTKFDSKDYSYWQDVIFILYPILSKYNIKIVQVGLEKERQYQYVVDFRGKTNMNQLAYVIKNASLHFGSDSFGVHLASGFNIPIVGLYSIIQSSVAGPYFGDKDKQILIESFTRTGNKKPSYSQQENPKTINLIKPEEIANAILKLLDINLTVPFETVYIGKRYGYDKIRDFIPNQIFRVTNPENPIEIRMDLEFNEKNLANQLNLTNAIIITNKNINLDLLRAYKPKISTLIYEIQENDDPNFIKEVRSIGIPIALISYLDDEKLNNKKINYYEISKINRIEKEKSEKIQELKNTENLFYKSNKLVYSNNKVYPCNAARKNDKEIQNEFLYEKVIDEDLFWDELDYMHIIKKV